MARMENHAEFTGYEIGTLSGGIWRSGRPNATVSANSVEAEVSSFCLTAGDPYEMEGALADEEGEARALAVVQDLERIKPQLDLSDPLGREILYDRRQPAMTRIEPDKVEALYVKADESRWGMRLPREDSRSLERAAEFRRKTVRKFRREGWDGAIVLPAFRESSKMVVVPRQYLRGALPVRWRGPLAGRVPAPLVDFSLELRPDFPRLVETGALPLRQPPVRPVTLSWRPSAVSEVPQK